MSWQALKVIRQQGRGQFFLLNWNGHEEGDSSLSNLPEKLWQTHCYQASFGSYLCHSRCRAGDKMKWATELWFQSGLSFASTRANCSHSSAGTLPLPWKEDMDLLFTVGSVQDMEWWDRKGLCAVVRNEFWKYHLHSNPQLLHLLLSYIVTVKWTLFSSELPSTCLVDAAQFLSQLMPVVIADCNSFRHLDAATGLQDLSSCCLFKLSSDFSIRLIK